MSSSQIIELFRGRRTGALGKGVGGGGVLLSFGSLMEAYSYYLAPREYTGGKDWITMFIDR
jgi:hypothetical protein